MKNNFTYTKIKPPKYRINGKTLNEYEVRCIMAETAKGEREAGIKIKDEKGNSFIILDDGRLDGNPYGFDVASNFVLAIIRESRKKEHNAVIVEAEKPFFKTNNIIYQITNSLAKTGDTCIVITPVDPDIVSGCNHKYDNSEILTYFDQQNRNGIEYVKVVAIDCDDPSCD